MRITRVVVCDRSHIHLLSVWSCYGTAVSQSRTDLQHTVATQHLWLHRIIQYLTLELLSSLWNICRSTTACFFDPPCTRVGDHLALGLHSSNEPGDLWQWPCHNDRLIDYAIHVVLTGNKKVKFSPTRYRALGPELIPVYRPAGDVKWITPVTP